MTSNQSDFPSSGNSEVDRLFTEYLRRVDNGENVDVERLLSDHPQHSAALRELIENTQKMDRVVQGIELSQTSDSISLETKLKYFGDYELLEEIGRGGMGVVYKARQISLNRIVAVKMIIAGYLASEAAVRRFKREAESVASMKHPAIVPVYEIGEHEGLHYYSMDYIEGQSLSELICEKTVTLNQAVDLVRQVAEAVHHAHQQGTLHRDLKPANILIDQHHKVHITDFGLAIRISDKDQLTKTGHIVGTPSYMAPEQAADKRGLIGPSSDLYSLGTILYELLSGKPPFVSGTPLETLRRVKEEEPVSFRKKNLRISHDLETICLKCLRKEPHDRYSTMQHLADDLNRYQTGEPVEARPLPIFAKLFRYAKKRRGAVLTTFTLLVVITFLIYTISGNFNSQKKIDLQKRKLLTNKIKILESSDASSIHEISLDLLQTDGFETSILEERLTDKTISSPLKNEDFQPRLVFVTRRE